MGIKYLGMENGKTTPHEVGDFVVIVPVSVM
jgi:hypothetical protein